MQLKIIWEPSKPFGGKEWRQIQCLNIGEVFSMEVEIDRYPPGGILINLGHTFQGGTRTIPGLNRASQMGYVVRSVQKRKVTRGKSPGIPGNLRDSTDLANGRPLCKGIQGGTGEISENQRGKSPGIY
jgi:hypothetical protein